ncbi:MAG: DUF1232 domain-containing protein [Weeksellaceae bacterium]|nr:DUF1232 domain-containing protein [Weeksellaceae bacterium]
MKYSKIELAKQAIKHKGFIKKIPDIVRMVNYWRKGQYPVNALDLILPLLGLLYVISPIDLLPEIAIPILGVADDLAVLSLALPKLLKEVDRFLLWEAERNGSLQNVIDAEIIEEK